MNLINDVKKPEYNVYCDESCHLEKDKQSIMLLGAIWCPKADVPDLSVAIRNIKKKHNANGEIKWTKVSKSKQGFYNELVNYFLSSPKLHFRCLVVKNKTKLNHDCFNQGSHDMFYYKMYFSMLNKILDPVNKHNIYIDIKDTKSNHKVKELKEILCNNVHDFTQEMISNIQHIHSFESELLQLADFLIGAVSYKNRNLNENKTKVEIVDLIEKGIGHSMEYSTPLSNTKFNIFIFSPREAK